MKVSENPRTSLKNLREGAAPRLELALYNWISDKVSRGIQVNGEIIRLQADKLQQESNKLLPPTTQLSLKFSKGWLARFQKRHGLKFRRIHGEAMSANSDALREAMPDIINKVKAYAPQDVWNADEFGLCYRQPPGWTFSAASVRGFKKDKSRLTFLACCNSTGSERFPLMVIGRAQRPRAFKGKYGAELGIDYHFNTKAWMTRALFFDWLRRLDNFIGRTTGRKIILFLDNCAAHGTVLTLPTLHNVEVYFLPPNTTSQVQPLDAGVIAALKAKFRRRMMFRVFENMEVGNQSIYNIDVLTAIRWIMAEWADMPSSCIEHCFRHCFGGEEGGGSGFIEEGSDLRDGLIHDLNANGIQFTSIGIESLLNPDGEQDVTEPLLDSNQVAFISGSAEPVEVVEGEEDEMEEYSITEQLKALAISTASVERLGFGDNAYLKAVRGCQKELRAQKAASLRQTTIVEHFGGQ